jgi:hypothetical protein
MDPADYLAQCAQEGWCQAFPCAVLAVNFTQQIKRCWTSTWQIDQSAPHHLLIPHPMAMIRRVAPMANLFNLSMSPHVSSGVVPWPAATKRKNSLAALLAKLYSIAAKNTRSLTVQDTVPYAPRSREHMRATGKKRRACDADSAMRSSSWSGVYFGGLASRVSTCACAVCS